MTGAGDRKDGSGAGRKGGSGEHSFGIAAASGQTVWQRPVLTFQPDGSPAVAGGRVYVQTGRLVALRERTGAPVWKANADSAQSPVVANGVVYTSSLTNNFTARWEALDAATGARLSSFYTPAGTCFFGQCTHATPVIANGMLFLAGPGPQLQAFRLP